VALETFNFLDSLAPANPSHSDGLVQGDAHIRGIKLAIKNTFPNVTGAITATQGALNSAAAWTTNGVNLLADAGVFFKTNSTDGFLNTLAGDIDVQLQGVISTTFQRAGGVNFLKHNGQVQITGGISATQEIKGPGITPIGAAVMWFDDVLPTDGLWVWANGQVIANANTVAPVLLARWGARFGGNGVTTMGVPDMQEVVPVGKSGMGGATAPGLLTSIVSGYKTVVNAIFGADTHTLTTPQIPSHTHANTLYDPGHTHTGSAHTTGQPVPSQNGNAGQGAQAGIDYAATGIQITNAAAGGGGAHNNVQPSKVVNWIIRIG
jgi:microcystin-dependent protein